MNKTLDSLKILSVLNSSIQLHFQTLATKSRNEDGFNNWLFLIVRYITIIQTISFLDEWDKFLGFKTEFEDQKNILELKKTAKPAIDRIKKWKDMREFRNCVLAHNLRNKNRNYDFIFINNEFQNSLIPNHISEFEVLAKCIDISTQIVCIPFKQQLINYSNELEKNDVVFKPRVVDPEKEIDDIKQLIIKNIKP